MSKLWAFSFMLQAKNNLISSTKTLHWICTLFFRTKKMKKNHLILITGLSCLLLVGCGTKTVPTDTIDTWMLFSWEQGLTWLQSGEILSGQDTTMRQELTGDMPNGTLVITGQQPTVETKVTTGNGVVVTTGKLTSSDVEKFKESLVVPEKTGTKLTEDDIDNIDNAIEFIKNMFK
jgi:hypothetical protein